MGRPPPRRYALPSAQVVACDAERGYERVSVDVVLVGSILEEKTVGEVVKTKKGDGE